MTDQPMTTAGLAAKVRLRQAWLWAYPDQPMPEARAEVDALIAAVEAATLRATPAPAEPGLDVAWAAAEAALPEGWHGPSLYQRHTGWTAYAVKHSLMRPFPVTVKDEPTPAAALLALAEKLREADR